MATTAQKVIAAAVAAACAGTTAPVAGTATRSGLAEVVGTLVGLSDTELDVVVGAVLADRDRFRPLDELFDLGAAVDGHEGREVDGPGAVHGLSAVGGTGVVGEAV